MKESTRNNLRSSADKPSTVNETGEALPEVSETYSHLVSSETVQTGLGSCQNQVIPEDMNKKDISLQDFGMILEYILNTAKAVALQAAEQDKAITEVQNELRGMATTARDHNLVSTIESKVASQDSDSSGESDMEWCNPKLSENRVVKSGGVMSRKTRGMS